MTIWESDGERIVSQARADAVQFFFANPEMSVFDHTYSPEDVRVRVIRSDGPAPSWHVFVYDGKGLPYGNPIWDSAKP